MNVINLQYNYSSLKFIEDYIEEEVLPDYGNTHTTTNVTSLQTTLFRHEARFVKSNFSFQPLSMLNYFFF